MNPTKRFKTEEEIVAAIEQCYTRSKALTAEAEALEIMARAIIKEAQGVEDETIELCEVPPVPTAKKAIQAELKRWNISEAQLLSYMQSWGAAKKVKVFTELEDGNLIWACKVWPQLLNFHIAQLRGSAAEKLKTARLRRTSAANQLNVKAAELRKKLGVTRTAVMPFMTDSSIPAK